MIELPSLLLPVGVAIGLVEWVRADWRYQFRWKIRRDQLKREGLWAELRTYVDRNYQTRRPFVRLFRSWAPGAIDGEYAIELHHLGEHELSLEIVERAIAKAMRARDKRIGERRHAQARIAIAALSGKALILDSLGRYDDVRSLVDTIHSLGVPTGIGMSPVALAELHAGRVDEAIAIARAIVAKEPQTDSARTIGARALATKGAFAEALAILDHPVSDGKQLYHGREEGLQRFAEAAASEQRRLARHASVMGPTRLLATARVHIAAEDATRALGVLERCARLVANNAALELLYQPLAARAWAQRGDASKADAHLARMWELSSAHPNRAHRFAAHAVAGACALELGRLDEALSQLNDAMTGLKHPIDRHGARYLLGRAHAAAGRVNEAAESYRAVVTDGFATRFHALALAALNRR